VHPQQRHRDRDQAEDAGAEPDQDLLAGAVLAGPQHHDKAGDDREQRAGEAQAHRQRRDEDQQQPDRRRGRDQDLVRHPGVRADPHRVDLVGVGGDVGRREQLVDPWCR
jgi:hypothetical protein